MRQRFVLVVWEGGGSNEHLWTRPRPFWTFIVYFTLVYVYHSKKRSIPILQVIPEHWTFYLPCPSDVAFMEYKHIYLYRWPISLLLTSGISLDALWITHFTPIKHTCFSMDWVLHAKKSTYPRYIVRDRWYNDCLINSDEQTWKWAGARMMYFNCWYAKGQDYIIYVNSEGNVWYQSFLPFYCFFFLFPFYSLSSLKKEKGHT